MKKMTVLQFQNLLATTRASRPRRIAKKLKQRSSMDPFPTRESAELRADAGFASVERAGLIAVARFYNLRKNRVGHAGKILNGFEWDMEAARAIVGKVAR